MQLRVKTAAVLLAALAGCAMQPAVSGFNGDSVTVQSNGNWSDPAVSGQAERICRSVGKYWDYASTRVVYAPQNALTTYEHLFLCLPDPPTPKYGEIAAVR